MKPIALTIFVVTLIQSLTANAQLKNWDSSYPTTNSVGQLANDGIGNLRYLDSGVINVKAYGALGNTRFVADGVITNASTTVTSATAAFTTNDVGKKIWGVYTPTGATLLPVGTVSTFVNSTTITVSVAATFSIGNIHLVLGTDDSDAIRLAVTAANAATPPGTVYIPAGGYVFKKLLFDFTQNATPGMSVIGASKGSVIFYPAPDFDFSTTSSSKGMLSRFNGPLNSRMSGFTVRGEYCNWSGGGNYAMVEFSSSRGVFSDIDILNVRGLSSSLRANGALDVQFSNCHIENNATGVGIFSTGGESTWINCYTGNHGSYGIQIYSLAGTTDQGQCFRWFGGLVDESTGYSVIVDNSSTDASFIGAKIMSGSLTNSLAFQVTTNSTARLISCEVHQFGAGAGNGSQIQVDQGGTLYITATRVQSEGTGTALKYGGRVYDIGGNSFTGTVTNLGTGVLTSPYANSVTLGATTNQVIFGATNSVPVLTNSIVKWVSVQVTGETNSYRIPIYE